MIITNRFQHPEVPVHASAVLTGKEPFGLAPACVLGSLSERPLMLLRSPRVSILGHQFMLQRSQSPALMSQAVPPRNSSDL